MCEPAFDVRKHPGCLRGLHFLYTTHSPLDEGRLAGALREAGELRLIHAEEHWGARCVQRFVLQFRFELRIGVEDDQVAFIHRVMAPPDARAFDRKWFERILTHSLDPSD